MNPLIDNLTSRQLLPNTYHQLYYPRLTINIQISEDPEHAKDNKLYGQKYVVGEAKRMRKGMVMTIIFFKKEAVGSRK